ncbi:MAG: bifunctional demethylmenaquinone methyltransferase/2-methoxy-6-polyprenyl-1,4-benzoquinol methylase UbiE [Pseudomonadales bacterium]|jgi:demethylmenaquinone methyltransferase/2-methoxy-6-polyprenyl-1,4-benzoquinol methylase|nr:bifunctional demethylmenaquinone methyltransferase/2-methoxy-6-polyprenyl-1,4-benzoquinol methylase UbiE [Pseudomonadales bacterium]MCP5322213.1 bifunctional demethylmenaquinone methyltransferase/2-methoxy-6-polyprenyl-1,4-benzoquinol methylase UbiE [Pseudomonadales bacterium]MCP5337099.1 bifunctional demethylmenaquinone methyltransferase/2-methoxy-6-polyprenyl-1,4-benzoquinol methylase UbiE [Pseudomonadales bacterium]
MSEQRTTDFGYRQVPEEEKTRLVGGVFDSVATRYDLMNDLMSGGIHRIWKRVTIELSGVREGHRVLDVAGGTGDLSSRFARIVGPNGRVVLSDINESMLRVGRDKLIDSGTIANLEFVLADAERLPFAERSFDCVTIAFGLRNVTHKERALESMLRVLRPGGRLLVLEFSKPTNELLGKLYDAYSFGVLPRLGRLVTGDADSYRYLAESIRMHPDQDAMRDMMEDAGFERCDYHNMTGGIVAIHRGFRAGM